MKTTAQFAVFGALILSGTASTAAPSGSPAADKNPNEIVCEKQMVIGSRLASKNKCLTRAQWAEQRRVANETVDGMQRGGSGMTAQQRATEGKW